MYSNYIQWQPWVPGASYTITGTLYTILIGLKLWVVIIALYPDPAYICLYNTEVLPLRKYPKDWWYEYVYTQALYT